MVYIPQRPSTISVLGQVMQPGSMPYRSGNTLGDYIEMAGGYRPTSDKSNTFIVLPDGSARKVETSWLNFSSVNLPPGSSIVVPRDITPLDTRQLILDVTGIFQPVGGHGGLARGPLQAVGLNPFAPKITSFHWGECPRDSRFEIIAWLRAAGWRLA